MRQPGQSLHGRIGQAIGASASSAAMMDRPPDQLGHTARFSGLGEWSKASDWADTAPYASSATSALRPTEALAQSYIVPLPLSRMANQRPRSAALYVMPSRQSSLSRGMAASVRSRSTTANRSAISCYVAVCVTIQRLASQSLNGMAVADNHELGTGQHASQKGRTRLHLGPQLLARVDQRIHVPPESRSRGANRGHHFGHRRAAQHKDVDVASRRLLALRY